MLSGFPSALPFSREDIGLCVPGLMRHSRTGEQSEAYGNVDRAFSLWVPSVCSLIHAPSTLPSRHAQGA